MIKTPLICAYCGKSPPKTTRDHVVPQAMWGGTRLPANVAIVPACIPCQNKWDLQAEYFRNSIIVMLDKGSHKVANQILEGSVTGSLKRNPKALKALTLNQRMVHRKSPGGIITGSGRGFQLDLERFEMVPKKIVRGLFYHKSQVPLSDKYAVRVFEGNGFWADHAFQRVIAAMSSCASFGDDVFQVRCVRDVNDSHSTAWLLIFYQQLAFFAWTEPEMPSPAIA